MIHTRPGIRIGIVAAAISLTLLAGLADFAEAELNVEREQGQPVPRAFTDWQAWRQGQTGRFGGPDAEAIREGVRLAVQRRRALIALMSSDPDRAVRLAIPYRLRRTLPVDVSALLETSLSGRGDVRVVPAGTPGGGVSADGLTRTVSMAGATYAAFVGGPWLADQDFIDVPLHGIALDGLAAVADSPVRVLDEDEIAPGMAARGRIVAYVGHDIVSFGSQDELADYERRMQFPTGVPVPGPREAADIRRIPVVRRVRPNELAWRRINIRRAERGLRALSREEFGVVPEGAEIEAGEGADVAASDPPPVGAGAVDNSGLTYFPPIRSQGSIGSCAAFSSTYYQMTHMTAMARGWNAKTGGDAYRFSPKWTYNMVNGGADGGAHMYWSLSIQRDHGCATWAEWPYDTNFRAWCPSAATWRNAIDRRMNAYYTITSLYMETGLSNLKAALDNGFVVTFDSYSPWGYQGWVRGTVVNDPATSGDDPYVGQSICTYVRALSWGHSMTVVGYNDDIWCDLNANGAVDAGEKGALKIANSWGTGWGNSGYAWFAYDALKTTSAVPGWNPSDKVYGFGYGDSSANVRVYLVTAQASYAPQLLARFTIRHALRDQVTMRLGKDVVTKTGSPGVTWMPYGLSGDGGAYAFDGTTTACDGTFWLDFSGVSPDAFTLKRYFVGLQDGTTAGSGELKSYTIRDELAGTEVTVTPATAPSAFNPSSGVADGGTAWTWSDHAAGGPLESPGGVSASDGTYATFVRFTWNAAAVATHYRVFASESENGARVALSGWQTELVYDDGAVVPCVLRYYWVKAATDASGSNASDYSEVDSGWRMGDLHLTVTSVHGEPEPAEGVHLWNGGTVLTNVVNSPVVEGSTQFVCEGWAMAGNDPASGQANRLVMVITNNAALTWHWTTNYWLAVQSVGPGSVTSDSRWVAGGQSQSLSAEAGADAYFWGWSGDTNDCTADGGEIIVPMDRPRLIVAEFYSVVSDVALLDVRMAGARPTVFWSSESNGLYEVYRTTDLGAGFTSVLCSVRALASQSTVEDGTDDDSPICYYRVAADSGSGKVLSESIGGVARLVILSNAYSLASVPFTKFAVHRGVIQSNTMDTIYDRGAGWRPGQFAAGVDDEERSGRSTFYIEITDTNAASFGRHFWIATNGTEYLRVREGFPGDMTSNALAGAAYRIVPGWRVRDIFGEPGSPLVQSEIGDDGALTRSGDEILLWNNAWEERIVHLQAHSFFTWLTNHWVQGTTVVDDAVIDRDAGFMVRRAAESNLLISIAGEVPPNGHALIFDTGSEYRLVGGGWARDRCIVETGLTNLLASGENADEAESIMAWRNGWMEKVFFREDDPFFTWLNGHWCQGTEVVDHSFVLGVGEGYMIEVRSNKTWLTKSPMDE